MANGLASFCKIRRSFAAHEVPFKIGISNPRAASGRERIGDAENDEAAALAGIEDARAVTETAGFIAEFAHLPVSQIQNLHQCNGLGHFLSVSANILHRRTADAAG